jgi:hypothetical protein
MGGGERPRPPSILERVSAAPLAGGTAGVMHGPNRRDSLSRPAALAWRRAANPSNGMQMQRQGRSEDAGQYQKG